MDQGYQVITIAGNGQAGSLDGHALESSFNLPTGLCLSSDGILYVADRQNQVIRMIANNQVATIAGKGETGFKDGKALESKLNFPTDLCLSEDGVLYFTDTDNYSVRMIYKKKVSTIAGGKLGFKDGKASKAKFKFPGGICCSRDGRLYVCDMGNNAIRMIYKEKVTTIAGTGKEGFQDGKASQSMFNNPIGVCCSADGRIYVTDSDNHRIRMIYDDQVTTIAGTGQSGSRDGHALEAMFNRPAGICLSSDGKLYISGIAEHKIRMLNNNEVTTIAGTGEQGFKDGNALESTFTNLWGLTCSKDGKIYGVDMNNQRIRMLYNN